MGRISQNGSRTEEQSQRQGQGMDTSRQGSGEVIQQVQNRGIVDGVRPMALSISSGEDIAGNVHGRPGHQQPAGKHEQVRSTSPTNQMEHEGLCQSTAVEQSGEGKMADICRPGQRMVREEFRTDPERGQGHQPRTNPEGMGSMEDAPSPAASGVDRAGDGCDDNCGGGHDQSTIDDGIAASSSLLSQSRIIVLQTAQRQDRQVEGRKRQSRRNRGSRDADKVLSRAWDGSGIPLHRGHSGRRTHRARDVPR